MAIGNRVKWYVRPGASHVELNGGGFDSTISGAGTNYADQDAAQLSLTDLATSGAGSTTVTSATGGFTTAMIGNCLRISAGTNFQAGYYFVTARTNTNTITVDRTPSSGGAGSGGTGRLGGAWGDLRNASVGGNFTGATLTTPIKAGNLVYVRSANNLADPTTTDYDYSAGYFIPAAGDAISGPVVYIGLGASDSEGTPVGRPLILYDGLWVYQGDHVRFFNFAAKLEASPTFTDYGFISGCTKCTIAHCIIDANGVDAQLIGVTNENFVWNNWCKNTGSTTAGSKKAISNSTTLTAYSCTIIENIVTNVRGGGIGTQDGGFFVGYNVVANCGHHGLEIINGTTYFVATMHRNTVYNATEDGIKVTTAAARCIANIHQNTVSKIPSGKFALNLSDSATINDISARISISRNNLHLDGGAGSLRNNYSAALGDTNLDPKFVNGASNNLVPGTNLQGAGFPTKIGNESSTPQSWDIGAVQRKEYGGRATWLIGV